MGRYAIRGGREGYERLLLLARDRWPDTARRPIVSEGVASHDEVTAALTALQRFTADPRTLIGGPRTFQLWSRR